MENTELMNGRPGKTQRTGQATLELTLTMIVGLLCVVGSVKVWLFFTQVIVEQQRCYEASRRLAGQNPNPGLALFNPDKFGGGNAPTYGNPFWAPIQTADGRPHLSIFGQNQLPNKCP